MKSHRLRLVIVLLAFAWGALGLVVAGALELGDVALAALSGWTTLALGALIDAVRVEGRRLDPEARAVEDETRKDE